MRETQASAPGEAVEHVEADDDARRERVDLVCCVDFFYTLLSLP